MGMNGDGRVRFRLSTAEEWANINPILDDGEPGCVRSGSMLLMKIGDGVTPWNELDYFGTNPLDIYPVGSIYTSTVNVSPETLFGGKWEKMPAGRVLVAEGTYTENGKTFNFTAGSTGGEAEHQLTIGELPSHQHNFYYKFDTSTTDKMPEQSWSIVVSNMVEASKDNGAGTYAVGNNQCHNNLQPYYSIYIYKRLS